MLALSFQNYFLNVKIRWILENNNLLSFPISHIIENKNRRDMMDINSGEDIFTKLFFECYPHPDRIFSSSIGWILEGEIWTLFETTRLLLSFVLKRATHIRLHVSQAQLRQHCE